MTLNVSLTPQFEELVSQKTSKVSTDGHTADQLRPDARVFVRRAYLIVYRPTDYGTAVLRVAHGARNGAWQVCP